MARTIDQVIEYIQGRDGISPVHKQVLINRVTVPPTDEEVAIAKEQVYPTR